MTVYLDNAATSFPKPQSVVDAVQRCMIRDGGNPGRGSHALSAAAARTVYSCREELCSLFDVSSPEQVCFTLNTTSAINTLVKGVLRRGDHVLISDLEHNAVWRPLHKLCREGLITLDVFRSYACDAERNDEAILRDIRRKLRPNTKMILCTALSNLCGVTLPLRRIGTLCQRHGILFAVDAAQGAGHLTLSLAKDHIDALCLPAHKGLYGPQGCGVLLLREGLTPDTLIEGGNGMDSLSPNMSDSLPERMEAGTLPVPAIAGLCEGIRAVKRIGIEALSAHEAYLHQVARDRLACFRGLTVYAPHACGPCLLFSVADRPSEEICALLNEYGICARGGFHCAALAHKTLGTPQGGAVRLSFGMYNRPRDLEYVYRALSSVCQHVI